MQFIQQQRRFRNLESDLKYSNIRTRLSFNEDELYYAMMGENSNKELAFAHKSIVSKTVLYNSRNNIFIDTIFNLKAGQYLPRRNHHRITSY